MGRFPGSTLNCSVEGCYFIEDLKTTNGTMINGEPLDAGFSRLITEDDRIRLGYTSYI